jgi:thiamine kinase-like enzyme
MKAVNMKGKFGGDDVSTNRLLAILKQKTPFQIKAIKQIRENVFYIKTERQPFILKGFSSLQQLHLQEAFTDSLKKEGFHHTYSFHQITDKPVFFKNKYFGWIEYIEPETTPFTYQSHKNRQGGLDLLKEFHEKTRNISRRYETLLPKFNLFEKWVERTSRFQSNLPIIRYFLPKQVINNAMEWAHFSLEGMRKENLNFGDEKHPLIIHGDVAHHNYLKSKLGSLYLIDFDLISIGYESADLLQYSNRIFPFINWSLNDLAKYPYINKYLNNRAFLFALMYPSDIFREWNRSIKDKTYHLPKRILPIVELTVNQFHLRQQLINDLKNVVK